jgi:hypothetical protein
MLFFSDYNYIYLVAGILVPLIVMLTSSQYCAGNLIALIIILGGGIGFFYFDNPYSHLSGAFSVYLILFKVIRYGNDMTGNYIDRNVLFNSDMRFLNELLNSDWYENNKQKQSDEIDPEDLVNQQFYQSHVNTIIQTLVSNNLAEFHNSKYNSEVLLRLHAIGTIYTLPMPISKNEDGLISVGTQMILNVFGNIKSINQFDTLNVDNEQVFINSAKQLVQRSENEFGKVSHEEVERIKTAENNS